MKDRFFTFLLIPEKTSRVHRLSVPAWALRASLISAGFLVVLGAAMLLDYWYVIDQIEENKDLRIQNRRLRQQVQIFKNKMDAFEDTMDRVQTFSTRLKVITNLEERESISSRLSDPLPDASENIGTTTTPEDPVTQQEGRELESSITGKSRKALLLEQDLQDLYELLIDQRSFLAALPTRRPAAGEITSGFGVRQSPYGMNEKMHEGLDIANHPGTLIHAPANGTVTFVGRKPGYGHTLIIDHGYGLETWYGHTRKILTENNQKITRGDIVAHMGSTGRSTGSHLHYEVRVNGYPVDPISYILENY